MRRARILDWVRMRRSHDRYNDVEPSSSPQSSPDYTIVIRGYNFREGHRSLDKDAPPFVPFIGSGISRHRRFSADFITIMSGFRFSVHRAGGLATLARDSANKR